MREVYIERRFRGPTRAMIAAANEIIAEYRDQGYRLTLRQLYYQHVARGLLANTMVNYRLLGRTMAMARDGGESDWDAVEDRTRYLNGHQSWRDPAAFLAAEVEYYAENPWAGQEARPEVWIEKDALLGVIQTVCDELRVPYFSTRGNLGQLPARDAGIRFERLIADGLTPVVLYLGDHDPSGIEMDHDLENRLARYSRREVEVRRLALTMAQVERYGPPANFAKERDVNLGKYLRRFGTDQCWELDALAPTVIADLIRSEVEGMIEPRAWQRALEREERSRARLRRLAKGLAR